MSSLYKPPLEPFLLPRRGHRIKPHIVIGNFNSHSSLWGYTKRIATEKRSSNGQIQTDWHSSTTRNCRNNSTVQCGRRDTTRPSSLYLQTFRICVRRLFWIQSPLTAPPYICVTVHPVIVPQPILHSEDALTKGKLHGTISQRILMKSSKKLNIC